MVKIPNYHCQIWSSTCPKLEVSMVECPMLDHIDLSKGKVFGVRAKVNFCDLDLESQGMNQPQGINQCLTPYIKNCYILMLINWKIEKT